MTSFVTGRLPPACANECKVFNSSSDSLELSLLAKAKTPNVCIANFTNLNGSSNRVDDASMTPQVAASNKLPGAPPDLLVFDINRMGANLVTMLVDELEVLWISPFEIA